MTKTASFVSCHRQTMLLARKTGEEQLSEECLTSAIIFTIIMMLVVIIDYEGSGALFIYDDDFRCNDKGPDYKASLFVDPL